jgi:hypothetical protein
MPKQFLVRRRCFRRTDVDEGEPSSSMLRVRKHTSSIALAVDVSRSRQCQMINVGNWTTVGLPQFDCIVNSSNCTVKAGISPDAGSGFNNCSDCNINSRLHMMFENGSTSRASVLRLDPVGKECGVARELLISLQRKEAELAEQADIQQLNCRYPPVIRVSENKIALDYEQQLLKSSAVTLTTAGEVNRNMGTHWLLHLWPSCAAKRLPLKAGPVSGYPVCVQCCDSCRNQYARDAVPPEMSASGADIVRNTEVEWPSLMTADEYAGKEERSTSADMGDDVILRSCGALNSAGMLISPLSLTATEHDCEPETAVGVTYQMQLKESAVTLSHMDNQRHPSVFGSRLDANALIDGSQAFRSSTDPSETGVIDKREKLSATARAIASDMLSQIENRIGDYVCRLCSARFSDAFRLAEHLCRRIRRAEHRCLECNKIFGCPANLASHQRWHRRRNGQLNVDDGQFNERYWTGNEMTGLDDKRFSGSRQLSKIAVKDEHPAIFDKYNANSAVVEMSLNQLQVITGDFALNLVTKSGAIRRPAVT